MATSEFEDESFSDYVRSEISKRDAEIERLKRELEEVKKQKGLSSAREGLTFSARSGLWADQSGQLYCPKCLNSDKRNPLKTEEYGWRCTACGGYWSNDKPLPVDPPQHWDRI